MLGHPRCHLDGEGWGVDHEVCSPYGAQADPDGMNGVDTSFYLSKHHITSGNPTPLPPGLPQLTPWCLRDKLKMVNGILLLCLNLDIDPPDVIKTAASANLC